MFGASNPSSMNQLQNLKRDRISHTARSQLGEVGEKSGGLAAPIFRETVASTEMADSIVPRCCHIGNPTARLTLDTVETCCAYYSAGTATPYSPSDPLRSAAAAVAAADETAVAVAASSATTPRLLTYRGIKNIRIARRWPPPPPYSWRVAGRGSRFRVAELPRVEPRACVYSIEPKERKQKPMRDCTLGETLLSHFCILLFLVYSDSRLSRRFYHAHGSVHGIARTNTRAHEGKWPEQTKRNETRENDALGVASLAPARHLAAVFSNEARPTSRRRHERCFCNWI